MKYSKHIPYFRGVFMRDQLPKRPRKIESGIINLDSSENQGTHWVAYAKKNDNVEYFDSYGDLRPPVEFLTYVGDEIQYNYINYQGSHPYNCGHLCLKFLEKCML